MNNSKIKPRTEQFIYGNKDYDYGADGYIYQTNLTIYKVVLGTNETFETLLEELKKEKLEDDVWQVSEK